MRPGDKVSVLLHDEQLVKVVPPPGVADEARENYRKQRRAELDARQKRRQEEGRR